VSRDKHVGVDYFPRPLPPDPPRDAKPSAEDEARRTRSLAAGNCSFVRVERLAGNVGYLRFDGFAPPEPCAETVAAAMTFVAGTQGLIVDLRENRGGSPDMVALVSSYLFDRRTHLNDLWTRSTGTTREYWTRDSVAGRRFGGEKPVIVLTSSRTFSAAEEFTYNLKALGRATVVGETTGGGAHPVDGHRIDDHFVVAVPVARAVNPVTRTNWEGTGIEPDVKVPASDAMAAAQERLRRPPPRP
jgi:C-terminal processing protease CtpA/Prc